MAIIDKIQLSGTVYTIGNETTTAVTSASTDNEIPTAKAVYDAIPQGGGGKAIEAGTNISITTGETADTINCTLPISGGTGTNALIYNSTINVASGDYSHSEGYISKAEGYASHAEGLSTKSKGFGSHAEGYFTITTNESEHSSGRYNNSVSSSTTFGDSGNTLFSVGNGTADNARHNAFEIRQNGDIYITKDGQDVKLQDQLGGGGGSSYTGVSGITINENNEIYYNGFAKTWLTDNHEDRYAVYWFQGMEGKIWINGNSPKGRMSHLRSQFSFGLNQLNMSIDGFALGNNNSIYGFNAGGLCNGNTVNGNYSLGVNYQNKTNNSSEFASGQYNNSVSASTTFGDSGNTLFSVGNGTSNNARHNAFEIRQNGDIYITKDGQDVKLQDQLGGGGSSYTAGDGIDITNDVISVTGKVDTSAITTSISSSSTDTQVPSAKAVYDQLGGLKLVKLSQSEYDSLTTKDNSTLYVIVN